MNAVTPATEQVTQMMETLRRARPHNRKRRSYYDSKQIVPDIRPSAIPKGMRRPSSYIGWARIAIDTMAERLRLNGFRGDIESGLRRVMDSNGNAVQIRTAIHDSLLYGVGFLSVSLDTTTGAITLTSENASATTVTYDPQTREPVSAITMTSGRVSGGAETYTGYFHTREISAPFKVVNGRVTDDPTRETIEHGYGFVPVMSIVNRARTSGGLGQSELSESMMSHIDNACVTLMEMAINRSLYANPQTWLTNVYSDAFRSKEGGPIDFSFTATDVPMLPPTPVKGAAGSTVTPGITTTSPGSPQPFTEVLRHLEGLFCSEARLPQYRLSATSASNPTSAEAIIAEDRPMNSIAEHKILSLIPQFRAIARNILSLMGVEDEKKVEEWSEPVFAEPQFLSATPDVVTLIGAGILQPTSMIALTRAGLTPAEARQVASENATAGQIELMKLLSSGTEGEEDEELPESEMEDDNG